MFQCCFSSELAVYPTAVNKTLQSYFCSVIVKVGGKELGLSHTAKATVTAEETDRKERQMEWGECLRSSKISLVDNGCRVHVLFVDSLYQHWHSAEAVIGHDWLNAVEKMLPQSSRADDGLCVCRLLIMGRACGSIYFIFMSQMVHVVIFMDKLDVQNTSVSEAVCRMLSLELLPPYPDHFAPFHHRSWCWVLGSSQERAEQNTKFQAVVFTEISSHCLLALAKQNHSFSFK